MSEKNHTGKIVALALILFIVAVTGAGYYTFPDTSEEKPATETAAPADAPKTTPEAEAEKPATDAAPTAEQLAQLAAPQPDDLVVGKVDAPVTILEYASLSCPHCAHFYKTVLPALQKDFVDTGKVRLVFRHFPHNEPGLRAAQLVNCADAKQRPAFVKALFESQDGWAFSNDFLKNLKPIVAIGGIDSAAFDACVADKGGETRILDVRKLATDAGKVTSVPSFFVNGALMAESPTIEHFRDAITAASAKK